jgi:hypothetical protein
MRVDVLMAISIFAFFLLGTALGWCAARIRNRLDETITGYPPPPPEKLWGWHDYYHLGHHHTDTAPWQKH